MYTILIKVSMTCLELLVGLLEPQNRLNIWTSHSKVLLKH